jgi:trimeric autotransporter adhesin
MKAIPYSLASSLLRLRRFCTVILPAAALFLVGHTWAAPVGTAFSYQGYLSDEGAPADGSYDLRSILYNAEIGGSQIGTILTNQNLAVQNGLINVVLDFGPGLIEGQELWLELAIRPADTDVPFTALSPRQSLLATPYASHAATASSAFTANAATAADTALVASQVPWSGIMDLPPDFADGVDRDTTYQAGDGLELTDTTFSLAEQGVTTANLSDQSVTTPKVADQAVTLAKLDFTNADTNQVLLFDGSGIVWTNVYWSNLLEPPADFPPAAHTHGFDQITGIASDDQLPLNLARLDADLLFTGQIEFGGSLVMTNHGNLLHGTFSGDAAGLTNLQGNALAPESIPTEAIAPQSITGTQLAQAAVLPSHLDLASFSTTFWRTAGNPGTTADSHFLGTTDSQPLELRANNTRALRLIPNSTNSVNLLAGSTANDIDEFSIGATIAGGGAASHLGFPHANQIYADFGTIGGGSRNLLDLTADWSTIAGGLHHTIELNAQWSTISGGRHNTIGIDADSSVISGGTTNTIQHGSQSATIHGGSFNSIGTNAHFAAIPGGHLNRANGRFSMAAGHHAHALHDGSFVWGDSLPQPVASSNTNQVTLRATGGVRLFTNSDLTTGVELEAGSGTWLTLSDRDAKTNFEPADSLAILETLQNLPILYWNYHAQAPATRHLGPVAQDFHAAFQLGTDPRRLATVDVDGVALAAIQGLNRKLEMELAARDRELHELRSALAILAEQVVVLRSTATAEEEMKLSTTYP